MRIFKAPFWAAALLLTAAPALGQQMYPGQSVTVNPGAIGGRVLLYPGGQYLRVERPLLQPGQRNPNAPIRLRPPVKRSAQPRTQTASAEPVAPAPSRPQVSAPPPPRSIPAPPPVAAKAPAKPPVQMAKVAPPPERTAQPVPAPSGDPAGWNKSGVIEFLPTQGEVQAARMDAVKFLAGALNNSLSGSPTARVEILAYGGAPGDKGSEARRLSLRRALSVRQALIDSGVSKDRIGVQAKGGVEDGGPPDRVDVFVHS